MVDQTPKSKPLVIPKVKLKTSDNIVLGGALESKEKQSSLAPEAHQAQNQNLQMALFTKSHLLANSVIKGLADVIDVKNINDSEEMIDWCIKENPKYILVDVDSPTLFSEAVAVFARVKNANSNIKQIIFTGKQKSVMTEKMVKKGAFAILKKPFSVDELLEIII